MKNKFLEIKGFKCFTDKTIPLNQLTVLAGGNSVGKSSIIQSLLLLRIAFERHKVKDKIIPLNGEYLLGLGNSSEVIGRKSNYSFIEFTYCFKNKFRAKLAFDIKESRMTLQLDEIDVNNETLPLLKPTFHYLHAERLGPRPFYTIGVKQRNVGWQGEFAIAILSSRDIDAPEYDISLSKAFPNSKNLKLRSQVEIWMNYIIPSIDLNPQKVNEINRAYIQYNGATPYNVGFGISYILPIITAGLIAREGEMLMVENPEAHLHPSGQSRIGQFLAKIAASGIQVIIETHSEHVINGIRLAAIKENISYKDIVFNFFHLVEGKEQQPEVKSIYMNERADLEIWPKGFFDQQQQDIATIFKTRKAKKL